MLHYISFHVIYIYANQIMSFLELQNKSIYRIL